MGGLVAAGAPGGARAPATAAGLAGAVLLGAFLALEARRRHPMLPLGLFRDRRFSALNAATLAIYAALGGALFVVVLQLQLVAGFGPVAAGGALTPITLLVLVLSPVAGRLLPRVGAGALLTVGPLAVAAGLWLLAGVDETAGFAADVLPGVAVMGVGLGLAVAPLTQSVLEAAPATHAGLASAVNNAVARLAGLLAVAVLPLAAGPAPGSALGFDYRRALEVAAVLAAAGGVIAAVFLRPARREGRPAAPAGGQPVRGRARRGRRRPARRGRAARPGPPPRG